MIDAEKHLGKFQYLRKFKLFNKVHPKLRGRVPTWVEGTLPKKFTSDKVEGFSRNDSVTVELCFTMNRGNKSYWRIK